VNGLQEKLIEAGLADANQLPPERQAHHFVGLGQFGKESEIRLYLPEGQPVSPDAKEIVEKRLESLGFQTQLPGGEIEWVTVVVPGGFDRRRWVQIKCRSSLIAGKILEILRIQDWSGVLPVERITTPGIQA